MPRFQCGVWGDIEPLGSTRSRLTFGTPSNIGRRLNALVFLVPRKANRPCGPANANGAGALRRAWMAIRRQSRRQIVEALKTRGFTPHAAALSMAAL